MQWYWRWNSAIPELQGLPEAQRRQLWAAGYRAAHSTRRALASYGLLLIAGGIGAAIIKLGLLSDLPKLVQLAAVVFCAALATLIHHQSMVRAMRPFMAIQRAAIEQQARADGLYYVPPAG